MKSADCTTPPGTGIVAARASMASIRSTVPGYVENSEVVAVVSLGMISSMVWKKCEA